MNTMATKPDVQLAGPSTVFANYDGRTFPPMSSARHEGCVWLSGFDFGRGSEDLSGLHAELEGA